MSPPIDFAVLGGNKCGTSALWKYSTANPALAWVGVFKENEYFANQIGKSALCDNVIEDYLTLAATQRRVALKQRPGRDVIVGDWASANLQCLCCPVSLKTLNPDLKAEPSSRLLRSGSPAGPPAYRPLVVVLRDPVQRALSVFLSAKRMTGTWWNEWTKNHTLATYVDQELASLRRCVDVARRFRGSAQTVAAIAGKAAAERARLLLSGSVQQSAAVGSGSSSSGSGAATGGSGGGSGGSSVTSELADFARRQQGQGQGQAAAGGSGSGAAGASSSSAASAGYGAVPDAVPRGWGAGMDLSQWMEAQCYAHSHLLGWSAYDVFLSNYLAHFPPRQLLVLYASQLAAQPAAALAAMEAHLGAPPGNYTRVLGAAAVGGGGGMAAGRSGSGSGMMRDCMGWHCAMKTDAASPQQAGSGSSTASATATASDQAAAGAGVSETSSTVMAATATATTGGGSSSAGDGPASSSPFARAVAALAEFYAPHVARLVRWGEEGRISPPPPQWGEAYGLDRHHRNLQQL
ncbi:hypothetical protein HYH02_015437 [Chlamydomonas schloesseri]|uniref:Sulfotransferase n=1 Tax=Chlamydomonas schloesseri TaxID=2026947 RepID=A0A835VQU9_9CHLO|nr:hypothetical protein HYH02_015437 [Chlamydomonas schloesseri]|eukprot:KAG2422488.1 hypothetical protein HYH02_015437 [Chlamydomonas schloesseri]